MQKSVKALVILLSLAVLVNCGITDRAAQVRETINTIEEISRSSGETDSSGDDTQSSDNQSSDTPVIDSLSDSFDPVKMEAFLSKLGSYRMVNETNITTPSDGKTETTTSRFVEERIIEPSIVRTIVGTEAQGTTETYLLPDMLYNVQNGECRITGLNTESWATSLQMARNMMGSVSMMLVLSSGEPKLVERNVTVNGQNTNRYEISTSTTGIKMQGEFWVREDGLMIKANTNSEMAGISTVSNYELSAIGEIDTISIPAECPGLEDMASSNVPKVDDAKITLQTEEQLSYNTSMPLEDVVSFYKERLAADGYEVTTLSESESYVQLQAKGSEMDLTIVIGQNQDGTLGVLIMISKN